MNYLQIPSRSLNAKVDLLIEGYKNQLAENDTLKQNLAAAEKRNAQLLAQYKLAINALQRIGTTGEYRLITKSNCGTYTNQVVFDFSDGARIANQTLKSLG